MEGKNCKIMVVDDDQNIRDLLITVLQGNELFRSSVVTADNCDTALNILRKDDRYDLVISDYKMEKWMASSFSAQFVKSFQISNG